MDSLVKPGNDSVGSGYGLINQTATFSPVLSFIFPYALRPTPYALRSTPYALLSFFLVPAVYLLLDIAYPFANVKYLIH